jgi:hypothetical protein
MRARYARPPLWDQASLRRLLLGWSACLGSGKVLQDPPHARVEVHKIAPALHDERWLLRRSGCIQDLRLRDLLGRPSVHPVCTVGSHDLQRHEARSVLDNRPRFVTRRFSLELLTRRGAVPGLAADAFRPEDGLEERVATQVGPPWDAYRRWVALERFDKANGIRKQQLRRSDPEEDFRNSGEAARCFQSHAASLSAALQEGEATVQLAGRSALVYHAPLRRRGSPACASWFCLGSRPAGTRRGMPRWC